MPAWLIRFAPQLLGLVLAAGLIWAAYSAAYGRGEAAERGRWERATAEAGERFAAALEAQQARLEELDAELGKARRSANRAREELSDAIQNDPASRDWAAQPVPDRVRGILAAGGRDVPADPQDPHR